MDNRSGLLIFGVFVLLFAFSFVFGSQALADTSASTSVLFGVLAFIGFLVCVSFSLMSGLLIRQEGGALAVWYIALSIVAAVIMVWYCTRCGTAFGWWNP